jgi:predicted hydrocarbon binding protein
MNTAESASRSSSSQGPLRTRPSTGRLVPSAYFDAILKAAEQEAGLYSLEMLLENAGIAEFSPNLADSRRTARASDISSLNQAIREYYGQGARGLLSRTGRGVWHRMLPNLRALERLQMIFWGFASLDGRRQRAVRLLENFQGIAKGQLSLHPADQDLILVDRSSDPTVGQSEQGAICWFTVGLIQAAFAWAAGREHTVEEIICRASGGDACKFRIRSL